MTVAMPTTLGTVGVWDANTGEQLRDLRDDAIRAVDPVSAVAFSPDSRSLAALSADGDLIIWDLTTLDAAPIVRRGAQMSETQTVAFSPDGTQVMTGSMFEGSRVWALER